MTFALSTIQAIFSALALALFSLMAIAHAPEGDELIYFFGGLAAGLVVSVGFYFLERWLRSKASLQALNTLALGILFGTFAAWALGSGLIGLFAAAGVTFGPLALQLLQTLLFLTTMYIAIVLTNNAAGELHLVIPFIHFKAKAAKKRELLLDSSVLQDPRLIDLANSGLIDDYCIVARSLVKDLHEQCSSGEDETVKNKARCALEVLAKLEALPSLQLRYTDIDFPEVKDPIMRISRLARHLDANILTADINKVQRSAIEGVRIINIHALSNALKPLMQKGEILTIKIQRPGKDPQQGIGYLDDGTMVVVNGGANFMGKIIQAQVLGVKHTSSGRMVFCNAIEEEEFSNKNSALYGERELSSKRYFLD